MNKTTKTIFAISLIVSLFITPILYASWKKEKERATEYRKHFFYLWDGIEKVDKGKATVRDLLDYLEELKQREEMMNSLAGEIARLNDDRF